MKIFKLALVFLASVFSLSSCVVDYGYYAYQPTYQSGYRSYETAIWEKPTTSYYSNRYCDNSRPRNVIPFDGGIPYPARGRVFRGGDGFLYLEQH